MALTSKEAFWKTHQDTLNGLRVQLSRHEVNHEENIDNLVENRMTLSSPGVAKHAPYGRYRSSSFPHLSKISNSHENRTATEILRGGRFAVVPPVQRHQSVFMRMSPGLASDTWGKKCEVEDYSLSTNQHCKENYLPKLHLSRISHDHEQCHQSLPLCGTSRDLYHARQIYHSLVAPTDNQHQNVFPQSPPFPSFDVQYVKAEGIMSELLSQFLEEEIIPDVIMDALADYGERGHARHIPARHLCGDVTGSDVNSYADHVSSGEMSAMLSHKQESLPELWLSIFNWTVDHCIQDLVRETVRDLASRYIASSYVFSIFSDLVKEQVISTVPAVMEEIWLEVLASEVFEDEVMKPVLEEEATEISVNLLRHCDEKLLKRELIEVSRKACGQLADSLMLQSLISKFVHQGTVYTQNDHYEKFLDGLIMNIAMEQMNSVRSSAAKTLCCAPLRKLHESVFIDMALETYLSELTASLDEDLADVDEFEKSIMENNLFYQ